MTDGADLTPATILSTAQFAALIGVSPRRVNELAQEKTIKRFAPGRFSADQVKVYTASLREKASRGVAVQDDLKVQRTRQATAAAEKIELQNAAARRELVSVAETESAWAETFRDVRAAMLAIPARVSVRLPTLTAVDLGEIDREIRDALAEASGDAP